MICKILTDEQITRIHNASLHILERTGVAVPHEKMLSLFEEAGATVDKNTQRVSIPAELVMSLLEKSTKQYILYGRDKAKTAEFGYGKHNFNSSAGQALWIDELGKDRRRPNVQDVRSAARLSDALKRINITGAMAEPDEMPMETRCIEVTVELIKNTTQPIHHWFHNRASAKFIVDMLIALRGSEKEAEKYPLCYPFLEPISPLQFPFDGIDLLFETSKLKLPVPIGPMAQTGSSAPATLAGTMALQNAEILAGMCITQLICPGTPNCYGGICHAFDMKTTQIIFSGPEQAIFGVAMTQMGKHYGFPVYVNTGMTDSKCLDAQAGLEMGTSLILSAAAGADIMGHMGICGADQGASLDFLVLQDSVRYISM